MHLMPTDITAGVYLYLEVNICSFSSLFFLLLSEEYNSYLFSCEAIFRLAQISGDPGLFLHLFLSLFASLLHLPPIQLKPLLCCVRMIHFWAWK